MTQYWWHVRCDQLWITASRSQLKEASETKSQVLWACPSQISWWSFNLEVLWSPHLSLSCLSSIWNLIPMFGNFLSLISYRTLSYFPIIAAKHDNDLFPQSPGMWPAALDFKLETVASRKQDLRESCLVVAVAVVMWSPQGAHGWGRSTDVGVFLHIITVKQMGCCTHGKMYTFTWFSSLPDNS